MISGKTIDLLQSLTEEEIKKFKKELTSTYKTDHPVLRLFDYLRKYFPEFNHKKLDKNLVGKSVFGPTFKDHDLRLTLSAITKSALSFIRKLELSENSELSQLIMIQALKRRGLNKYFQKEIENLYINTEPTSPEVDPFFTRLVLTDQLVSIQGGNIQSGFGDALKTQAENYDHYYFYGRLRNGCAMINTKNVVEQNFDFDFLDKLIALVEKDYENLPNLQSTYLSIYKMLKHYDSEQHYKDLKAKMVLFINSFTETTKREVYTYAQNYCIRKLNLGDISYIPELLELYKMMLKDELLYENNYLPVKHYKNITFVSLRSENIEWTKDFLYEYKNKLPEEERETAFHFNLACYYFAAKRYNDTLDVLKSVEFVDILYALNSRFLLLKTYFELEETDAFYSLIHSFRSLLSRNKQVNSYQKEFYGNFIKYLVQIDKLSIGSKEQQQKLKLTIQNAEKVADKSWLLSKCQ